MSKKGVKKLSDNLTDNAARLEALVSIMNPPTPDVDVTPETLVTMKQGQASDTLEETERLFQSSVPIRHSLIAKHVPKPRVFLEPQLSSEQMEKYKAIFNNKEDPFLVLAKTIKHQNAVADSDSAVERKHSNLTNRLTAIIPAVQFAVNGAREEYREAMKNTLPSSDINTLKQRMESFEYIQDLFVSLKSLTKNRNRYTEQHFADRVDELNEQLNKQNIDPNIQSELMAALSNVVENNIFNNRKFYQSESMGSTPFDRTKATMQLDKFTKRVKIEHTNNGQEINAVFSYSRRKILGQTSSKLWKTRAGEFKEFRSQIKDLVNIGISEYNKGSHANPINIKYVPANVAQPEAALMLLMEYKKRAVMEGKSFYAKDQNGSSIEITPSAKFTDAERAYFMNFALAQPQMSEGKDQKSLESVAGYKIFKQAGVKMEKTKNPNDIKSAMDEFLSNELKQSGIKLNEKLDTVSNALESVAVSNAWKENTVSKAPKLSN